MSIPVVDRERRLGWYNSRNRWGCGDGAWWTRGEGNGDGGEPWEVRSRGEPWDEAHVAALTLLGSQP